MPVLSDDVIKKYIHHEEEINIKLNPKIYCPELVGTNLTLDAACANDKCGKPVVIHSTGRENCDMHELQQYKESKKMSVHLQSCVII